MTKASPLKATGAHVSIIGHITEHELRARLTHTEAANGFANRFLFLCVKRSKVLPFRGDDIEDCVINAIRVRVAQAVDFAKTVGRLKLTLAAREIWVKVYTPLTDDQPGLLGSVVARGAPQVIRLALIYALLDLRDEIDAIHLLAALAVWEYCEASAVRIFGDALGDPVADEILRALEQAGKDGLTRTAIRDLFGRNQSVDRIGTALALLLSNGRAKMGQRKTGAAGRPVETWYAAGRGQ
jgi:hypothetical protein